MGPRNLRWQSKRIHASAGQHRRCHLRRESHRQRRQRKSRLRLCRAALVEKSHEGSGQMQRTVETVDFVARDMAVVHVLDEFSNPAIQGREVFVLMRVSAGWKDKVGASVPWAMDDGMPVGGR